MSSAEPVNVGIIGGGLIGREAAVALARWPALLDHPVIPKLIAACDTNPAALEWFRRMGTVEILTSRYEDLLAHPDVDVLYVALPHHLHERVYVDAIEAGKDFLAEKPFGKDLAAASRIVTALGGRPSVFVRCSSEMPFFPGAQLAYQTVRSGALGRIIEAYCGFLHSGDLDPDKPINWKRRVETCGVAGVMADLGMHALHVPLRLGWVPTAVFATLQNIVAERWDERRSKRVPCETIDNASLQCRIPSDDGDFPLTVETKRIAPGETNTWRFRVVGMRGGVEFSTKYPKSLLRFALRDGAQAWEHLELGSQSVFPTVTGAIFEFGFSDAVLQMWAAFLAERRSFLGDRFGCATPGEAELSHLIFDAALRSADSGRAEALQDQERGRSPED
jgi:predicted dehydrogenase